MRRIKIYFNYCCISKLKLAAIAVILLGVYSCKREVMKRELLSNYEANTYSEAFEVFWNGINSNYLFWDQETINWNNVYNVYKPKFDSLDKRRYSDTTMNLCFQYMVDMTKDLKDGQYALQFWSGGDFRLDDSLYKSYISFVPKYFKTLRNRPALPDTLFDYVIQNNYLNNFDYGIYRNNNGGIFQIITGKISKGAKNVLYTNLNMFSLKEAYNANYTARPARPVIKNLFDNIKKSNCDGVIIDLRNNRGGNLEDIDFFVGQFTSKPELFGYARYKSTSGKLDYTPLLAMAVTPQTGASGFKKPIVILTDSYSAALCESVILAFKSLPDAKVILVGERTYGSAGMIVGDDISNNGGNFNVGNLAAVRLSNAAILDKNRRFNFTGFSPDVEVKYDEASIRQMLRTGVDIQLEKAIEVINK